MLMSQGRPPGAEGVRESLRPGRTAQERVILTSLADKAGSQAQITCVLPKKQGFGCVFNSSFSFHYKK